MIKRSVTSLLVILFLLTLFSSSTTSAYNHVISNSQNWKDVYSIIHYANLNNVVSSFLVSPRHAPVLLNGLNKDNEIRVITSQSSSYIWILRKKEARGNYE